MATNFQNRGEDTDLPEEFQNQGTYSPSSPEELRAALQKKDEETLKIIADFENFRRRVSKEVQNHQKEGKRELLLGIIEIMDNFDRALQSKAMQKESALTDGVRSIYHLIKQLLESHQVLSYDSVGQRFDPLLHEALHILPDPEYPEGFIIEEFRKGYVWDWIVLRPALVTVIQNAPNHRP
jgi:molecular chaperone GrpE